MWEKYQTKDPRLFESVILDKNIGEEILKDLSSFLANKAWHNERSIPYILFIIIIFVCYFFFCIN